MFPKKDSIWTKIKAARGIKKSRLKPLSRQTIILKGYPGEIDELKLSISDKIEKYGLTILPSSSPTTGPLPQIEPTDIDVTKPHATITADNFDGWIRSFNVDKDGRISTHINVLESVKEDLQLVLHGLLPDQTQKIHWIVHHNPCLRIVNPPKVAEDAHPLKGQNIPLTWMICY